MASYFFLNFLPSIAGEPTYVILFVSLIAGMCYLYGYLFDSVEIFSHDNSGEFHAKGFLKVANVVVIPATLGIIAGAGGDWLFSRVVTSYRDDVNGVVIIFCIIVLLTMHYKISRLRTAVKEKITNLELKEAKKLATSIMSHKNSFLITGLSFFALSIASNWIFFVLMILTWFTLAISQLSAPLFANGFELCEIETEKSIYKGLTSAHLGTKNFMNISSNTADSTLINTATIKVIRIIDDESGSKSRKHFSDS